jgi:hypothetical protein
MRRRSARDAPGGAALPLVHEVAAWSIARRWRRGALQAGQGQRPGRSARRHARSAAARPPLRRARAGGAARQRLHGKERHESFPPQPCASGAAGGCHTREDCSLEKGGVGVSYACVFSVIQVAITYRFRSLKLWESTQVAGQAEWCGHCGQGASSCREASSTAAWSRLQPLCCAPCTPAARQRARSMRCADCCRAARGACAHGPAVQRRAACLSQPCRPHRKGSVRHSSPAAVPPPCPCEGDYLQRDAPAA